MTGLDRTIAVTGHGRYLVRHARVTGATASNRLLVGFHGYAERAETQLERLETIAGAEAWTGVAVQGLHRFYQRRSDVVVASWMTRQDRELMIADNLSYVAAVIDAVRGELGSMDGLVFVGFSQGVATAFRSAALGNARVSGLIALGGDIPPDLSQQQLSRIPSVLLGRGRDDEWYTAGMFDADQRRLRESGVHVVAHPLDGGHEWTPDFSAAAGEFLRQAGSR